MHKSPWDSPTGIHRNPLRFSDNELICTFQFNGSFCAGINIAIYLLKIYSLTF